MKVIRLWGVIAFFVLLALLVLSVYFIAPMLLKSGIETAGSKALGAKVEIDSVDLSLFPAGVEIKRLQATDPDKPMQNLFEVGNIKFALDTGALLWKKIQIDELEISEIQLATTRTSSGELTDDLATQEFSKDATSIDLPEITESDIKSLVEKSDLVTLKRLNELDASQKTIQTEWKTALDEGANKQRLKSIEDDFKRLSERAKENKMNLLTDRKAWKKLKKRIDSERKNIKTLNGKLTQDKVLLKKQIAAVRAGPKDDLTAVMGNVGLSNGIAGLSDQYLGPQFTPWLKKVISLISSVKVESHGSEETPVYSTKQGIKVEFRDEQIFPDVLIKNVVLSGKDSDWSLSGKGSNLGYFPWLVGQPAKLNLEMSADGKANFSMVSDWKSADEMLTQIDSKIKGWAVTDFNLMKTDLGNWVVKSGRLDSTLVGDISLKKVNLKLVVKLNQTKLSAPKKLSGWQKTLALSLNQQKQLGIEVMVSGNLEEPKFKISSSLDNLFKDAVGQKMKQQTEKYKGKFQKAITDKVGDLGTLDEYTSDLEQWTDKLKVNDDLLKQLKVKF